MARRRGNIKRDSKGRFARTSGSGGRRSGGGGGGAIVRRAGSAAAIRRSAIATRSPGNVAIKGGRQPALRIPKRKISKGAVASVALGGLVGYGVYRGVKRRKAKRAARR